MNVQNTIHLTGEQQAAIEQAEEWFTKYTDEQPVFQFTGYAGTGKTTCIKELVKKMDLSPDRVLYAAFTGKAALVMRKTSNVPARTIHSLIYKVVSTPADVLNKLQKQMNDETNERERDRLFLELEELKKPRFELNPDSELCDAKLLVLDECSMVNEELLKDLLTFDVPIIALGDPGQLPPVEGTGALFVGEPDVKLEQIHRQAEGNPILAMATRARNGQLWPYSDPDEAANDRRFFMTVKAMVLPEVYDETLEIADQILCGMHRTRKACNISVRKLKNLGGVDPYPVVGDRVICRRNYRDDGLFNGLQAVVLERGEMYDYYIEYLVQTEVNEEPQKVQVVRAVFDEYINKDARKNVPWYIWKNHHEFDFAYCLTVHVAQGSQWDKVVLLDDGFLKGWGRTAEEKREKKEERGKWLYTAVTRAAEQFTCFT